MATGRTASRAKKRKVFPPRPLRPARWTIDVLERSESELLEWVAGWDYAPHALRAYRVARVAIRALVQHRASDVKLVTKLHQVLADDANGLDPAIRDQARADLELSTALWAAVAANGGAEGLETARRLAVAGFRRLGSKYDPTVEELHALAGRYVPTRRAKGAKRADVHTIPGLVAILILKSRGVGEEAPRFRMLLAAETDRVSKSTRRHRARKT